MKPRSLKKMTALIVALAMLLGMGVFAMAEPALPEVVYGDENHIMFGAAEAPGQLRYAVAEPVCTADFQLVGLKLVDSVSFYEFDGDLGDYIGYTIGANNTITFELHSAPDGSELPPGYYDWWFEPQIIGNVVFNGEDGNGYLRVLADGGGGGTIEGDAVIAYEPDSIEFIVDEGYTESPSDSMEIMAYEITAASEVDVQYAEMTPCTYDAENTLLYYLSWESSGNKTTFRLSEGLDAGTYSCDFEAINVECEGYNCYLGDTPFTVSVTVNATDNELYTEFTPDELSFDVEKGNTPTIESVISASARYYSDDSYAENTYISAYTTELVSATAPNGSNLAGINPMQYITVDRGTTMSVLTVDIRPASMPAGSYVWMLTTIVTGDWKPCDSDPVYIYLNVGGGGDDDIIVSCDPNDLSFSVNEGYDSVSPQEVKVSVKNSMGKMLPFTLGRRHTVKALYPQTADFSEYVVCENSVSGDALNVSLDPGLPEGEYVFEIYPHIGYNGNDVGVPFKINVTVSAGGNSGTLIDADTGESVNYALEDSAVNVTGDVAAETPVYVAVYNEKSRLISIKILSAPGSADVSGGSTAKLLWINADGFKAKSKFALLYLS
ncbi:MAG: hypothetical protein IJG50_08820 [Clostridia bacterium]|nr:hypothetical protein [Clostridia bacterium]